MPNGLSLLDLGDISKPADTLIHKISDVVGGLFRPFQIKRIAKAESEAALIQAESQIEITDLHRRAFARWLTEESQKQDNMENITIKAIPLVKDDSKPQNIDNDWIVNFFNNARLISNEQMQLLWSRILAGEANSPGSFTKRTVNLLSSFDKKDAELFESFCAFVWYAESPCPLIFDYTNQIYTSKYINFDNLAHLGDIGFIDFNDLGTYQITNLKQDLTFNYRGKPAKLHLPALENNILPIGKAIFTNAGKELSRICTPIEVPGFYEYVLETWKNSGITIVIEPSEV